MSSVTLLPSKASNLHFYSEGQTVSYFGVCGIVVHAVACRKPSSVRRYILQLLRISAESCCHVKVGTGGRLHLHPVKNCVSTKTKQETFSFILSCYSDSAESYSA